MDTKSKCKNKNMFQPDIEDLRYEIYDIKKQNSEIKSENHLLKVRVRKLSDDVNKKSRQIANLLNPNKAETVRKLLSQHGTSFVMSLREENSQLHKELHEKDNLIRKLHNELQVFKLYSEKSKLNIFSDKFNGATLKIETLSEVNSNTTMSSRRISRSRAKSVNTLRNSSSTSPHHKQSEHSKLSLSTSELKSITDLEKSYLILLNNNLKTIKECGIKKATQSQQENGSPLLNSVQSVSPNELPHIEVQQLQSYFMNVLSELDYLKEKVVQLQAEQAMKTNQSKDTCNYTQKSSTEIQNIHLNSNEKFAENEKQIQKDEKTISSSSSNIVSVIVSSNPTEIETESSESLYEENSLLRTTASDPQNSPTYHMHPEMKSVSVQTTRHFCAPHVFTDKDNCEVDKIINCSLKKIENDIEVQYI